VNPNMQSEKSNSKTLTQMETCNYQNLKIKIKIQKKSENFYTIKKSSKNTERINFYSPTTVTLHAFEISPN
jgi:hypothetical protein